MFGFETGLDFSEIGGSYQTETANRKKCCRSALASMRIRIQHFTAMRNRIQGGIPMRIHADLYQDPF
jgi:hypothetical protein